jgi:hypothetical protein
MVGPTDRRTDGRGRRRTTPNDRGRTTTDDGTIACGTGRVETRRRFFYIRRVVVVVVVVVVGRVEKQLINSTD